MSKLVFCGLVIYLVTVSCSGFYLHQNHEKHRKKTDPIPYAELFHDLDEFKHKLRGYGLVPTIGNIQSLDYGSNEQPSAASHGEVPDDEDVAWFEEYKHDGNINTEFLPVWPDHYLTPSAAHEKASNAYDPGLFGGYNHDEEFIDHDKIIGNHFSMLDEEESEMHEVRVATPSVYRQSTKETLFETDKPDFVGWVYVDNEFPEPDELLDDNTHFDWMRSTNDHDKHSNWEHGYDENNDSVEHDRFDDDTGAKYEQGISEEYGHVQPSRDDDDEETPHEGYKSFKDWYLSLESHDDSSEENEIVSPIPSKYGSAKTTALPMLSKNKATKIDEQIRDQIVPKVPEEQTESSINSEIRNGNKFAAHNSWINQTVDNVDEFLPVINDDEFPDGPELPEEKFPDTSGWITPEPYPNMKSFTSSNIIGTEEFPTNVGWIDQQHVELKKFPIHVGWVDESSSIVDEKTNELPDINGWITPEPYPQTISAQHSPMVKFEEFPPHNGWIVNHSTTPDVTSTDLQFESATTINEHLLPPNSEPITEQDISVNEIIYVDLPTNIPNLTEILDEDEFDEIWEMLEKSAKYDDYVHNETTAITKQQLETTISPFRLVVDESTTALFPAGLIDVNQHPTTPIPATLIDTDQSTTTTTKTSTTVPAILVDIEHPDTTEILYSSYETTINSTELLNEDELAEKWQELVNKSDKSDENLRYESTTIYESVTLTEHKIDSTTFPLPSGTVVDELTTTLPPAGLIDQSSTETIDVIIDKDQSTTALPVILIDARNQQSASISTTQILYETTTMNTDDNSDRQIIFEDDPLLTNVDEIYVHKRVFVDSEDSQNATISSTPAPTTVQQYITTIRLPTEEIEVLKNEVRFLNDIVITTTPTNVQSLNATAIGEQRVDFIVTTTDTETLVPTPMTTEIILDEISSDKQIGNLAFSDGPLIETEDMPQPAALLSRMNIIEYPMSDSLVFDKLHQRSDVAIESDYLPLYYDDDEDEEFETKPPRFDEVEILNLIPIIIEQLRLGSITESEKQTLSRIFGSLWSLIDEEAKRDSQQERMNPILSSLLKFRMIQRAYRRDYENDVQGNSVQAIKKPEFEDGPLRIQLSLDTSMPPSQRILRTAAAMISTSNRKRRNQNHRRNYRKSNRVKKSINHEPFDSEENNNRPSVFELIDLAKMHHLRRQKLRETAAIQKVNSLDPVKAYEFAGFNDYDPSYDDYEEYSGEYVNGRLVHKT